MLYTCNLLNNINHISIKKEKKLCIIIHLLEWLKNKPQNRKQKIISNADKAAEYKYIWMQNVMVTLKTAC